jgi:hypothetical protein
MPVIAQTSDVPQAEKTNENTAGEDAIMASTEDQVHGALA